MAESAAHRLAYIKAEQIWATSEKLLKTNSSRSSLKSWQYALASLFIIVGISFYQYSINSTTDYEFQAGIGEHKTVE
ncbi:MAG: hypothetical protein IPK77_11290 [Cellvibrio sp.]|nr:hypothetical protein [Cellvibrio sp.]